MKTRLLELLEKFPGKKILVIGDIMLDHYIYGNVSRISPEAPVPVVIFERDSYELGGAGNTVSNLCSLGARVSIFGFIGKDSEAEILKKILRENNVDYFLDENSVTTTKTRIVGKQQIVRLDKEEVSEKFFSNELMKKIIEKARDSDFIIISDYAKGTVTRELLELLNPFKEKIIADTKPKNLKFFRGIFLLKPNEKEALEMTGEREVKKAGEKLRSELGSNVLITRGANGMILFSDKIFEIPTYAREVYDVSGAGDTVIAALAMALSAGASLEDAAILANNSAGIAVEKPGTYSVNLSELKNRIMSEEKKIVNLEELKKIAENFWGATEFSE